MFVIAIMRVFAGTVECSDCREAVFPVFAIITSPLFSGRDNGPVADHEEVAEKISY